jgi:hypothetical protein
MQMTTIKSGDALPALLLLLYPAIAVLDIQAISQMIFGDSSIRSLSGCRAVGCNLRRQDVFALQTARATGMQSYCLM